MAEIFENVFDALEDNQQIAENLKIKSWLMIAIATHIKINRLSQREAANLMGVSQPRISDLVRGKIQRFTIDMLINMLSKVGLRINLTLETIVNHKIENSVGYSIYDAGYTLVSTPQFCAPVYVKERSIADNANWNA